MTCPHASKPQTGYRTIMPGNGIALRPLRNGRLTESKRQNKVYDLGFWFGRGTDLHSPLPSH